MPSSVTIPDHLRKKIKKLAAEFDTSQAEIINMALDVFEKKYSSKNDFTNPKVLLILKEASDRVRQNNLDRKKRAEILERSTHLLEEVDHASWGQTIED